MPIVSVIIPIFNTSAYIKKCAVSLFTQTLKNVEYIFIDDASTDNSIEVLNDVITCFPELSDFIKIIKLKENHGQSKVREIAKGIATGDYFFHCDSDDWIDIDLLEKLYTKAASEDLDIVTCDLKYVFEDGSSRIWEQHANSCNDLCSGIIRAQYTGSLCNKLIKSSIINSEIIVPKANMGEDWLCSVQYSYYAKKIGYITESYYNYLRHSGSTSFCVNISQTINRFNDFSTNFVSMISFMESNGSYNTYKNDIVYRCLNLRFGLLPYLKNKDCEYLFKNTCKQYDSLILKSSNISLKEKLIFLSAKLGFYKYTIRTN